MLRRDRDRATIWATELEALRESNYSLLTSMAEADTAVTTYPASFKACHAIQDEVRVVRRTKTLVWPVRSLSRLHLINATPQTEMSDLLD